MHICANPDSNHDRSIDISKRLCPVCYTIEDEVQIANYMNQNDITYF